jgi:hypothetical protein
MKGRRSTGQWCLWVAIGAANTIGGALMVTSVWKGEPIFSASVPTAIPIFSLAALFVMAAGAGVMAYERIYGSPKPPLVGAGLEAGALKMEKVQAEPSMEEILASIRRIIAEDEAWDAALSKINPPLAAECLIALVMSDRRAEGLLGDLSERFYRYVKTRGLRHAQALYWADVVRSIFPIVWAKAKKLGAIAAIAEIWRRTHF